MPSLRTQFGHRVRLAVGMAVIVSVCAAPALAAPDHGQIPSAVPRTGTPAINNGGVFSITQVGDTVVAGGSFTSVTPPGGAATTRSKVVAFDANTGALRSFNPVPNADIQDVLPGPLPNTVYIAGSFTTLNGASTSHVALLNSTTGAPVAGFRAAATNGAVNSIRRAGNRLILGGNFTTAGGVEHRGFASLNATTGAIDAFMGVDVTQRHNDSGSGAQGAVGVRELDVTPDGSTLVAIGNFKRADGLERDQAVLVDLSGASAVVDPNWRTRRYEPYCFNWAFDTYMRGLSMSPDGSYFVITSTGGHNAGTLCDTAARFETDASGLSVQPTWVNYSGGDTLWGVTVTETAVYVGGHQRWLNNSRASDYAGPGAVPRPGLAALNTQTGIPLKWNPGRNPRGEAAYTLYPSNAGLWVGSDTDYIGNRQYRRPRLAMFPLASGAPEAPEGAASVPGTAYLGGRSNANGNVLHRVNAGGGTVGAVDNGPDWQGDEGSGSPYRNSGSNPAGWGGGASQDATVPSTTPNVVFDTERWDPSDEPPMRWTFPAPSNAPLSVRLYFANRCDCTAARGSRVFDVSIDGTKRLDNFDIVDAVGDQRGTMREFNITSDGVVNIDFSHEVENPLVNAIEIVRRDLAPPAPGGNELSTAAVSASGAQPATNIPDQGIDWTTVRGSFMASGKLWYGKNDGSLNTRTYEAGQFGPEIKVNPYHDPAWAQVDSGSGGTFNGNPVDLYAQFSSVTGMALANGRLYYTKTNDSNLYWRWFNADSGIIGTDVFTANAGRNWSGTMGMFAASGRLYFATRSDGNLNAINLTVSGPTGSPSVVDGPVAGGNDWRTRALFLVSGAAPPPNPKPTAEFSQTCTELICEFDASDSSDDTSIEAFEWEFGDSSSDSGQVVNKEFAQPGTYPVKLTVTDNLGATGTITKSVLVTAPPQSDTISFVESAVTSGNVQAPVVRVPAGVQEGDTLVLAANMSNATSASVPAGWSLVGDQSATASLRSMVWVRRATATDANSSVRVTMNAVQKAALVLTAYRGVNATNPVVSATASTDAGTNTHTTPTVPVPNGSWVMSVWGEKSSSTSKYTTPGDLALRGEVYNTGTGRTSTAVADSNGPRSGSVPGATATTDATSGRGVNWSIVLAPR